MHKFKVTVFCADGTRIEYEALFANSIDATMDAMERVGGIAKVKVTRI